MVFAEKGAGTLLVTALDEVAWLLNLRGGDVSYNPVFLAYVLAHETSATLYVDPQKVCLAAVLMTEAHSVQCECQELRLCRVL